MRLDVVSGTSNNILSNCQMFHAETVANWLFDVFLCSP